MPRYRKVAGAATIRRIRAGSGGCAAQERTPDWPAWENASFRNHADHTATPEFREGMAELRDLGRTHTCAVLCAEAAWWRCHRRTPARFADYVRRFASSGSTRHLHA